ncbi:MAG TPA: hypothetical protein VMI54_01420 [Polyangiaceae bacterium]|nr:hypothetical protein [Polyangiaceae bacterium]
MRLLALALAFGLPSVFAKCQHAAPPPAPPTKEELAVRAALTTLRSEETALRAHTDFATELPSSRSLGSNPYALADLDGSRFVGLLRGDSRVVLLSEGFTEQSAQRTAPSPSALAVVPGRVLVVGPLATGVERFRVNGAKLEPDGAVPLPSGVVARGLAADAKAVVVLDFVGDRLLSWPISRALAVPARVGEPRRTSSCAGPLRAALSEHYLAVTCLFDHAVSVLERDAGGEPGREVARIVHDGPLWSVALREHDGELFIGAGGVEDHPLERRDRVFGYIDSFVYLYVLGRDGTLVRRQAVNASELGVVTPKAVVFRDHDGEPILDAVGYGSSAVLSVGAASAEVTRAGVPGCNALVARGERLLCADPLLDAWVELAPAGAAVHVARPPALDDPNAKERLGEALFFTTLMAPDARSDGRLSRFTCETCHFEGATDGRVHNSGRQEIRVSTRPLFGLFNDAPHFSRAHDRDLTSVCHNEFAVANRGNPVDPWFSLATRRFPWLARLGVEGDELEPLELRRALLAFLARFSPEENPFVATHAPPATYTPRERDGAELFRARCASCHAARLVANDPATEVPFAGWESAIFSRATPLVWARADYAQTGILPYVDPQGTRIPSLRRLYLKRPYFTNGSARSLAAVLERARFSDRGFFHAAPPAPDAPLHELDANQRAALLDFLRLL